MTKIYFIRHAEADISVRDSFARPLTIGRTAAANALATHFNGTLDAVYSSPYLRAVDTVKPLAKRFGLTVIPNDSFRERKISNDWIDDFWQFAERQWNDFDYKLPGGESLREVQSRNIAALNGVLSNHADKTAVIGTHGTALATILNFYNSSFNFHYFKKIVNITPYITILNFKETQFVNEIML